MFVIPLSLPVIKLRLLSFLTQSIQESQLLFQDLDQIQSSKSQKRKLVPLCLPEFITDLGAINEKEKVE